MLCEIKSLLCEAVNGEKDDACLLKLLKRDQSHTTAYLIVALASYIPRPPYQPENIKMQRR